MARDLRDASVLWRVFWVNAIVLAAAGAVLVLSPATVSSPVVLREVAVIGVGLCCMLVANVALTRRAVEPLLRMSEAMREVDPLHGSRRLPRGGGGAELGRLTASFNAMLDRLEAERRRSTRLALEAQEAERGRIAQELHDQIGQALTVLLLQIEATASASPELRPALAELAESVRATMDEVRRLVRDLRPEALDDLGLTAALDALGARVEEHSGVRVSRRVRAPARRLDPATELVVYRVAQEAMTNVIRHAEAHHAVLELDDAGDALVLKVVDDGVGIDGSAAGAGIQGMRERAIAVGGRLDVGAGPDGGTVVELRIASAT